MMDLSNLRPAEGSVLSDNFRRGRGHGSGNGKTAGKGHKGQKARSGAPRPGFEGGQMPLYRRIPKRGFTNRNRKEFVAINVNVLDRFDNGAEVTVDTLIESGIVKDPKDGIKILANGELTKKLTVKANAFSAAAKEKIEALGGTCEVIQYVKNTPERFQSEGGKAEAALYIRDVSCDPYRFPASHPGRKVGFLCRAV